MKEWYVDFSGYCVVRAESESEAWEEFYRQVDATPMEDATFEIDCVDEKKEVK